MSYLKQKHEGTFIFVLCVNEHWLSFTGRLNLTRSRLLCSTSDRNQRNSPNLSFQAWNSRSSRDKLAQLATARTAATTSSSFILTENRAEMRSSVTCRKPHRLRVNSFTSALPRKGFSDVTFLISSRARFLWLTLSSQPQTLSPIYETLCFLLCAGSVCLSVCLSVCVCCCLCLPASMSLCMCGEAWGTTTCRVMLGCDRVTIFYSRLQLWLGSPVRWLSAARKVREKGRVNHWSRVGWLMHYEKFAWCHYFW